MSSELIDPKRPGVINLTIILILFKVVLALFFFFNLVYTPHKVHTKRHDLQLEISQKNDVIAQLNKKIILCDKSTSKKTVVMSFRAI